MSDIIRNLDFSFLTDALWRIIPVLICLTIHELSHGAAAYALGDMTAKNAGRLSLNPIKHIDPFGLICMLLFRFGWAKPVPVNMRNFKNPRAGMAITALAGPVSNLLLALLLAAVGGLFFAVAKIQLYNAATAGLNVFLQHYCEFMFLSAALAIFNIIPIPPLDGSKVLFSLLPDTMYMKLMRVERFGFIILFVFINSNVFSKTFGSATDYIANGLINKIFLPVYYFAS